MPRQLVVPLVLVVLAAVALPAHGQDKPSPAQRKVGGAIFRVPGSFTLDVALRADGTLLARAGADQTVDLWDVDSGKKLHTLKGHTAPLLRVTFSPDGKTLASITGTWLPDDVRGEVKLWDVTTGKERVAMKGHPNRGMRLAFAPDGKTLATSSATSSGNVKLWDTDTGKEKLELKLVRGVFAWSLAFSPDGKTLAVGTGGFIDNAPSSVILWDATTGKELARTLPAHGNLISCVTFAPDGKTLASASGGAPGALKLWDVAAAKERVTIPIPLGQLLDLVFTADGKTLISAMATVGETKNEGGYVVQHWDLVTGKARATYWSPASAPRVARAGIFTPGTNAGFYFGALSADGKTVAWGGAEENIGKAHVWDVQSLATSPPKSPAKAE